MIQFYAGFKHNMETKNRSGGRRTRPLSHRQKAKMASPGRSASHNLYKIYHVLFLHMSSWSSNNALIVFYLPLGQVGIRNDLPHPWQAGNA